MSDSLRFAIIGGGVIGETHAEAISLVPEAELVAVADVDVGRAKETVGKYGARVYADYREMLQNEQLDVVDICTPSGLHGEIAREVMRSGRHVIVEKPMEITRAAMDEMLYVQQETGMKMAVISQHRFDPASQQVHGLVQEGAFGRLVMGNAIIPWWRSQAYYDKGAWRGTWRLDGGGVLMNQSIHSIDLLQWMMGRVRSVVAYTDTLVHRMETEDVAAAVLHFASGALGVIAATTDAYPGVTTRIEIYGDQGSAVIEDDQLRYLYLKRDEQKAAGDYGSHMGTQFIASPHGGSGATAQNPAALSSRGHMLQIADMIRAIKENGTPLVDGYAARHPVEIILAIYESARTHKEVML